MTKDKEVPYSTELVDEVLHHFRKPSYQYKTDNIFNKELIEFSIKQLEFSQEFLKKISFKSSKYQYRTIC